MRALVHVHSTYSYDGESSLAEIADWSTRRGIQRVFLTEHTNDFGGDKMRRFVSECAALSGPGFRLVPGLEFPVRGGFHILGLGVTDYRPLVEGPDVARFVRDCGGVSVLAHPARYAGRWPEPETTTLLDAVEAWNARYDGRFLPSGRVFASLARLGRRNSDLRFLGGQDLHRVSGHRLVTVECDDGADDPRVLLAHGVTFGVGLQRFSGSAPPGILAIALHRVAHAAYQMLRTTRDTLQSRR